MYYKYCDYDYDNYDHGDDYDTIMIMIMICRSERLHKNMPTKFLPGFRCQPETPNLGGALSSLGQVHGLANGLSAGGLLRSRRRMSCSDSST